MTTINEASITVKGVIKSMGIVLALVLLLGTNQAIANNTASVWGSYGTIGTDGLGNLPIGYTGRSNDIRMLADHSGKLTQIRACLCDKTMPSGPGEYWGGTGGTIIVTIYPDDGSANHLPVTSSPIAVSNSVGNPASTAASLMVFPAQPSLVAGTIYHFLFTNIDPNSSVNFTSLDYIYNNSPAGTYAQPQIPWPDLAVGYVDGGSLAYTASSYSSRFTPCIGFDFADGYQMGFGWLDIWHTTGSGTEIFTPSATMNITAVGVRLNSSTSTTVTLTNASGTVIFSGTAAAIGNNWSSYTLPSAITLTSGTTYHLTVSGSWAGTEKASGYGWSAAQCFGDGYASGSPGDDYSFYFLTSTSSTAGGGGGGTTTSTSGGSGSDPSTCTYAISPASQSFGSSGGTGSVSVTTQTGCTWNVSGAPSWLTVTSGSSGTGSGKVTYSVAANTGTSTNTAAMTVASQIFTVTESGTGHQRRSYTSSRR